MLDMGRVGLFLLGILVGGALDALTPNDIALPGGFKFTVLQHNFLLGGGFHFIAGSGVDKATFSGCPSGSIIYWFFPSSILL